MEKKYSGVVNIVDECIMHRILFLLHSFFLRFSQCFCHVNGSTLYALLIQYNVCRLLLVYKTSFQIALRAARAKKNAKQRCKQCMICVWFAQLCTYLLMRKCIFMTWTGARNPYTAVSVRLSPFFFLVFVMYEIGLTTSTSALIHANFFVRDSFPYDNTIFRPLDLRTIRSRHHFCWPRFLLALLSSSRLLRIYTTTKNVYCFVFVQMIGCLLLCTKWSVECLVRTKKVNFFRSFIVDFTHDATNASVFCCCFRFFFLEPWT